MATPKSITSLQELMSFDKLLTFANSARHTATLGGLVHNHAAIGDGSKIDTFADFKAWADVNKEAFRDTCPMCRFALGVGSLYAECLGLMAGISIAEQKAKMEAADAAETAASTATAK